MNVKDYAPVADWKQAIGLMVAVLLIVFIAKKLPLPAALKP